ncbi:hypothetical protein [Acetobacter oeni]|uniref:Uncharacterized protein n=1 Tax=Acetobacter oeni TaxID=304077 RepID=A0A511XJE0_9PROT|nr:hypothetical protein [Acetobacter oeni]MBB3882741.1 hypothetical protein [Acetobacter oeni]NHO18837.1 hypothetical protein [Acetobacter oeni]GBR04869.1 hypothetical protein AA21952_1555 [Acetobacter oeni LMG 21952]GEN63070.1 hypothetical protein AOE01nite_12940 [Acetobacter oeni]
MGFIRSARAMATSLAVLAGSAAWIGSAEIAHAMTAKECHAKFTESRKAGTLTSGQTYKEFKTAQCSGAEAEADDSAPATATPAAPAATPAATKETASPVSSGNAVFPGQVSSKYSSLSAGAARRKTCLDQYHANKANGGNGGLTWIKKGGGYYSLCNKRLKSQ